MGVGGQEIGVEPPVGKIGAGPPVGKIAARTTAGISGREAETFRGKDGEIMAGRLAEEGTRPQDLTTEVDRRREMDGEGEDRRGCR